MQTMALFACQPSSRVDALLELLVPPGQCPMSAAADDLARLFQLDWLVQQFVVATCYVPATANRLLALTDLPLTLARVAFQAQSGLRAWFAWSDGPSVWFFVAEITASPNSRCHDRAIRMFFYDKDGRFLSSGAWALQSDGSWLLCER